MTTENKVVTLEMKIDDGTDQGTTTTLRITLTRNKDGLVVAQATYNEDGNPNCERVMEIYAGCSVGVSVAAGENGEVIVKNF